MSNLVETNRRELLSLGFSFHGAAKGDAADPEQTVLRLLCAFYEDRKLYRMLLTWLEATSHLIHMERLNALAGGLPPGLRIVLGATAFKLSPIDRRWKAVAEAMVKATDRKGPPVSAPEGYADPFLISKYGIDEGFREFGVKIAKIAPEDRKKIRSLKAILQNNDWLRIRALIGPNFRADIAYLYLSNRVHGPADAARFLKCSKDTAYRNWRAIEDADARKLLKFPPRSCPKGLE